MHEPVPLALLTETMWAQYKFYANILLGHEVGAHRWSLNNSNYTQLQSGEALKM